MMKKKTEKQHKIPSRATITEVVYDSVEGQHSFGLVDEKTMREFEKLCAVKGPSSRNGLYR